MRQRADRDVVGARARELGDAFERDAPGDLDLRAPNGFADLLDGQVVEQDDVSAGRQSGVHIRQALRLDFDGHLAPRLFHPLHGLGHPARQPDVVVLDEDPVVRPAR